MLMLHRCAWHPRYFAWPRLLGWSWTGSWRRWGFTDGMCERCGLKFKGQARRPGSPSVAQSKAPAGL
jgi:hypothetical protein